MGRVDWCLLQKKRKDRGHYSSKGERWRGSEGRRKEGERQRERRRKGRKSRETGFLKA